MNKVLDLVEHLKQIVANSYDGAVDKDGKPIKTGLKREMDIPFTQRRVMDGFKVKISGNKLTLIYHSEMTTEDYHKKDLKADVGETVGEIVKFLKKEYKKETGDALTLKEVGEPQIDVSNTSRVRSWVVSKCFYEIGGLDEAGPDEQKEKLDKAVKDWMSKGRKENKPDKPE